MNEKQKSWWLLVQNGDIKKWEREDDGLGILRMEKKKKKWGRSSKAIIEALCQKLVLWGKTTSGLPVVTSKKKKKHLGCRAWLPSTTNDGGGVISEFESVTVYQSCSRRIFVCWALFFLSTAKQTWPLAAVLFGYCIFWGNCRPPRLSLWPIFSFFFLLVNDGNLRNWWWWFFAFASADEGQPEFLCGHLKINSPWCLLWERKKVNRTRQRYLCKCSIYLTFSVELRVVWFRFCFVASLWCFSSCFSDSQLHFLFPIFLSSILLFLFLIISTLCSTLLSFSVLLFSEHRCCSGSEREGDFALN